MKSIATVNFKGGVGKTTITWLLAQYASERKDKKVLVVDSDAQMSLTLAVQLKEDGRMQENFEKWYDRHTKEKRTILNALDYYDMIRRSENRIFDFQIDDYFIYRMNRNLHFIPSVVDLYWLELEVFNRERVKNFIRDLLGRIQHSKEFNYDYVFFDCPPNFTVLSYSVLSSSNLILIPVNPDVFASRGISLMIDGLRHRIQPWPNPKIAIFMNKARLYRGNLTRETESYWRESRVVCDAIRNREGVSVETWDSYIPERADIRRSIPSRTFPDEFEEHISRLWENIERCLSQ
jgi:chromosome partitioning protein